MTKWKTQVFLQIKSTKLDSQHVEFSEDPLLLAGELTQDTTPVL